MASKTQPYTIYGYPVRQSRRSQRIKVQVATDGSVEVVVPVGCHHRRIAQFLVDKRGWIDKTQSRMAAARQGRSPETRQSQPSYIFLRALDQPWHVEYHPTAADGVRVEATASRLQLFGSIHQVSVCQTALQRWVRQMAKYYLEPWLNDVSTEIQLPYIRASIRRQKTRWASCSSRKTISLNDKLLFLPPDLVRYVLVHELCHTVHLNHSAAFWSLVRQWEPGCDALNEALKDGWQYVPDWVTAE